MEIYVKIEMNEIIFCKGLSHYNYLVWKLHSKNALGITHFIEKYDDVSDDPEYTLGTYVNDEFVVKAQGYGDSIYNKNLGIGGIFVDICIESLVAQN
jgi:hypothetical protein